MKKNEVEGQFVLLENEKYYEIKNYDEMQPFFISLASDSNHWMYISSTGGLSAGRRNADEALFPYYTDDKISESAEITGSKTIVHVEKNGAKHIWEPFSDRNKGAFKIERSIAKSTIGNKLIFTEKNLDLGLTFSYKWMNADDFGWVKKSELTHDSNDAVKVYIVDGLQNILPSGIDKFTQNTFSTLVDGYKKTELVENTSLALYRMEAILVDRAEPSESLRANTVWSVGLENVSYLLSSKQLNSVRNGEKAQAEVEAKGVRGAYFACADIVLASHSTKQWYLVAEVAQDIAAVNDRIYFFENTSDIPTQIELGVKNGTDNLINIVAQADGIQNTADENNATRHFANVLFNTMRGGIYSDNYVINGSFFRKHVQHFNVNCAEKHQEFLKSIPEKIDYNELKQLVENQQDANLTRLFLEYLPLTFSRRHGDPSRPWNAFNINIKDENGDKLLSYQGNWRDIFQNWEALSLSYPEYINGIIAKFLNATSADGYNPYKMTNEGIEWEVIEPDNPWSNIGYWGDHQIIYLLKLMEVSQKHFPEILISWLNKEMFAYANIPYRLKNYAEIVENPKNSIRFDDKMHKSIEHLVTTYGADAKLILLPDGEVKLVSFTEKILATLLAKLSNFIPEAGIWMNTLRPEWNDANNALVGNGTSMVTLYYIRRFVSFVQKMYLSDNQNNYKVSEEMNTFFNDIFTAFIEHNSCLTSGFDNVQRRNLTDQLGQAGEAYRTRVYSGFSAKKELISKEDLLGFFTITLEYIDQSIAVNKRADNLYHAYNLVKFTGNEIQIRYLYEMLEGQVAVLTSGVLPAAEVVSLLGALRASALYRPDQNSYMLYPNKKLPDFIDKNNISPEIVQQIGLLLVLVSNGDKRIITTDKKGQFHFNASFNNASFLHEALVKLKNEGKFTVTDQDMVAIEEVYEQIFDHQSFTGRSGTFYKYEGLGCIYWHMVSKLLLAVAENIQWAVDKNEENALVEKLKHHYSEVKAGIGAHKSPADYGSFPFDPYSHTPTMAGVQQPGMTGQVKEDIISRYFELGVFVEDGCINFRPAMLNLSEFIQQNGKNAGLSFSYCSVPVSYEKVGKQETRVVFENSEIRIFKNNQLDKSTSQLIFGRNKAVKNIRVFL